MLAAQAINTDTRILTMDDSIAKAREQMDELNVDTLPVIESETQKLVGQITRETLRQPNPEMITVAEMELEKPIAIFNNQHLFYAVRLMLQHELDVLPVIDRDLLFQGIIQKHQVMELLGEMLNLTKYGSIITIELSRNDFTLSEIVQIIETEGGRILGVTVEEPDENKQSYEVSIKLNLQDVSRVASSLRRYDYTISTEAKSESHNIDLETRADEFLKYLDI